MLYPIVRPALFARSRARARTHLSTVTLHQRHAAGRADSSSLPSRPVTCMGLTFPNALGLAAGLDKNAECIDAFGAMGFGFVEVGTVTPRAQPGNDKPRMFRLVAAEGIINRMGFNNLGVDHRLRM